MKAIHKEFWMEIRRSKARFISIFFIVALGVAFFAGIQASSPDMRYSGDAYYDEAKLMDIKVMGTMGLTDEDVQAVKAVDGVQEAEGAYSTDVMCGTEDERKVLHIESVNQTGNRITASQGRLPEKSGEIFLDKSFAEAQGYEIGDSLAVTQSDSELLVTETYTVVGMGSSPLYISFNRGNTTLGSGEVNGFAYVLPEDFDQEVFTQIYIRVHGAEELTSYTDAFDNLIEKIEARVEGIQEERCQIRYDEVVSEAQIKLDDARKELEDGKKEAQEKLADAKKELEDAEKELKDGKKEYKDGKQKLADAKKELEDGRQQIEDAKKELEDGRSQLADAKAQLSDGRSQLTDAKNELAAGWAEVNANQSKLDEGKAQLESGKAQLQKGLQQIEEAKNTLNQSQKELDEGKAQIAAGRAQIAAAYEELNAKKQQCQDGLKQVEEGEAGLAQMEAGLASAKEQLAALTAQYESAVASGEYSEEELEALNQQVAAAQASVEELAAQTEATRSQLAATRSELESGLATVEANLAALPEQEAQLDAKEAELPAAQKKIDQGWSELESQEKTIEASRKEIESKEAQLEDAQSQINAAKNKLYAGQDEIDANEAKLDSAAAEIAANEQKLIDGQREIEENQQKITDGEKEIKENEQKLRDTRKDIKEGEKKLEDGKKEYEDAKKEAEEEIADGEKEIRDAQKEIDDLEVPEWIISDRHDLPEYSDYGDNADRIRNLGDVFPVIFFLVAALVSLTTMTRMVEEQRTQIGTMKALGYGKYSIASKYLNYAFLATVGGSALGILIGEKVIPYVVITGYGIMYHNMASNMQIHYELKYALMASGTAVLCTLGATLFSCYKVLLETPASLMRPPAPKEGKRVLVERITFLWKHLNFTWKSTLRNLFRYKKRLFMTIFGIAGSMGLLLVGYGLQDSIMDIAGRQYQEIQHYDGTVIDDSDATDEDRAELDKFFKNNEQIERFTHILLTKANVTSGHTNLSVYVYVPENTENFSQDVTLQDRKTKEPYALTDEGAVICEKTASLTGLGVGDELTIKKDHKKYSVKIAAITENYMGHYVYMTPSVYQQCFKEKPDYANTVFTVKEEYKDKISEVGNEILTYPAALSISYTSSLAGQLERMLGALELVIVVLIVSAGMLAFVVLYNLNNINITERQRELATLKVLGFYDREVSEYVFRENILLTIIGIAAGMGFGVLLHSFVVTTVEVDAVMFGREINPVSFLYSALFTVGFSLIVNFFMHNKLKKIDMVESLKSVE